jgi:hypothetical protein
VTLQEGNTPVQAFKFNQPIAHVVASVRQELYGNIAAGRLMSGFSRLFTHYLQGHGFTCGINDVLLSPAAECERATNMKGAELTALVASASVAGLPEIKASSCSALVHLPTIKLCVVCV